MTQRQKNIFLWVLLAALFLICLYSEVRQGSSAVKYIGRITLLTVLIYQISQSGRKRQR